MEWSIDDTWTVLIAIGCAVACVLPGSFLVLRRMGMMSDAISHTVLPGIAIGFLISGTRDSWPMFIGAALFGLLTAVLTQTIHRWGRMEVSTAMGVVFTALFALGLILIRVGANNVELDPGCVLYGNLEFAAWDTWGTSDIPRAVPILSAVILLNLVALLLFFKELKLVCFDSDLARTLGIPVNLIHFGHLCLVAITTVAAFELVGSIMVVALIIVPPATAWLLCNRLIPLLLCSVLLAVLAAVLGFFISIFVPPLLSFGVHEFQDASMAGSIAVATGLLFVVAWLLAPEQGLLARIWRRRALRRRRDCEDVLGVLFRLRELPQAERPVVDFAFLAEAIGLRQRTLRRAVAYGRRRGWLQHAGGQVLLSENGREQARRLVRAHRLWEGYLQLHFGLASDHLHAPAHRLEHIDDPLLEAELQQSLGHPTQDPHGREVP